MTDSAKTFDTIWEEQIYGQGRHLNRYPYDAIVSFVYRHCPRAIRRNEIQILEVGSGAGNNLWFAAREGFSVAGIDGSASAIAYAKHRFADEGLSGELVVGDFAHLPFENERFDLLIDRAALTCAGRSSTRAALAECARVLKPGGKMFCNPYSDRHSSKATGKAGPDGVTMEIKGGTLEGVGQICFWSRGDIDRFFGAEWKLLSIQHVEQIEQLNDAFPVHAEWRIIVEKGGKLSCG